MITEPGLSGAASDKLGLMSTAGEGAAISVCLTTCRALVSGSVYRTLPLCLCVCERVCVSRGERDENKTAVGRVKHPACNPLQI